MVTNFLACGNNQKRELSLLDEKYQKKQDEFNHFKDIIFSQNLTNNLNIKKKIHFLKDRDTLDLCEDIELNKTIFFYFNEYHCSSCVKQQISIIEKFNSSHGKNISIRILAGYSSQRNLNLFIKANNIRSSVYYVTEEKLDLPITIYNIPFYFLVNDREEIIQVSVADKENPIYNEMYLEKMKWFLR